MPIQTFNEQFLPNAKVPATGSRAGANPSGPGGRAVGNPAIQTFDPAGSPKVNRRDLHAERSDPSPAANAKFKPSAVDSFDDAEI